MIHIKNNKCPICLNENLSWHINISKSDMHMFKCGHGTCKSCYTKLNNSAKQFACPLCREPGQAFGVADVNLYQENGRCEWKTFAEWYNEYEIYIKSGAAKNVINNTTFGLQLKRLSKEARKVKAK